MINLCSNHLSHKNRINLGAFYTPKRYVTLVWNKIKPYIKKKSIILDSSCGYGNFFETDINAQIIGNDIDIYAVEESNKNYPNIKLYNKNALLNVSRDMFNIDENNHLIIIGNPPYNDTTSIIRNSIKDNKLAIDSDIKTRDYGMSFLLSYAKLEADIVCVLHPLSYLIKKANFNLIKKFANSYKLIEGTIIDSATFTQTQKGISFPIIIALYKKDKIGMNYDYIKKFTFTTIDNKKFSLNSFDFISSYIKKYPIKGAIAKDKDILFWTMRDINALKRNRTFVDKFSYNTIIIDKNRLEYYIYVDVFKQFSKRVPYYFGNFDVIIDNNLFQKYKKYFISECASRHKFLYNHIEVENIDLNISREYIVKYFKEFLGEHYVY